MRKILGMAAVILVVGLASPALAETGGGQDFFVVFAGPPGSTGSVVATGAFTGAGTVVTPEGQPPAGFPAVLTFPQGTLVLGISPTGNGFQFDPRSCVVSGPIFGTYQVTGGTGQFLGASGSGTFQGQVFALFGRDAQGECVDPASGQPPVFLVQVIRNPGTLTLPAAQAA
ncbi:MAG: hypothetical protein M3326_13680 [Actinomycetota bacterium]|nr:hypothetical protein [Actinomycetota bacterium]